MDQLLDRITLRANGLQATQFVLAMPRIKTPDYLDGGNGSVYGLHTMQLTSGNGGSRTRRAVTCELGAAHRDHRFSTATASRLPPLLDEPLVQRPNRTSLAQGFDIDIDTFLT